MISEVLTSGDFWHPNLDFGGFVTLALSAIGEAYIAYILLWAFANVLFIIRKKLQKDGIDNL